MTYLAGFLDSAARHLGRILDKEVIQYINLPTFLHTYWTSNCTHWSKNEHLLVWLLGHNLKHNSNHIYYIIVDTMPHLTDMRIALTH